MSQAVWPEALPSEDYRPPIVRRGPFWTPAGVCGACRSRLVPWTTGGVTCTTCHPPAYPIVDGVVQAPVYQPLARLAEVPPGRRQARLADKFAALLDTLLEGE